MFTNMLWALDSMQQGVDFINRNALAAQCRLLRDYLEEIKAGGRLPHDMEVSYLTINSCAAELISPKGSTTQRYVLYLHGGGFSLGSLDTHRELVTAFARHAEARVLAIDYRLAPDNPWPAGLEDSLAAYTWLLDQGVSPERIAIAGDSAGGSLAVALLQRLQQLKLSQPAACVLLSPWLDLSCSSPSIDLNAATDPLLNRVQMHAFAELYAGGQPLNDPEISPLFGSLAGLAPIHVQVSAQEVLRDDAKRLVEGIEKLGGEAELVEAQWMPHVWQLLYRYLPQAAASVRQASRFIKNLTQG